MIKKVIPISMYDQDLIIYLYTERDKSELKTELFKEYDFALEDNTTLGAVIAKSNTDQIITWINIEKPNLLKTVCHESVHLAHKILGLIGETEMELTHTEIIAYTTGWMFQSILDQLIKEKIINNPTE
jgi:cytidine deaminase